MSALGFSEKGRPALPETTFAVQLVDSFSKFFSLFTTLNWGEFLRKRSDSKGDLPTRAARARRASPVTFLGISLKIPNL